MTYTYKCTQCKTTFSVEHGMTVENLKPPCPTCASTETRKVIHSVPVIYKGEGFTKKVGEE